MRRLGFDASRYGQLDFSIRSYAMDDDMLAPDVNLNWLLNSYASANIERVFLKSLALGSIGQSHFFKEKFKESLRHDNANCLLEKCGHAT